MKNSHAVIMLLALFCFRLYGQSYRLTDLAPSVGTNSFAEAINNKSEVVGYVDTVSGARSFIYSNSVVTDLGPLLNTSNNFAVGINDAGQVVGFSERTNGVAAFLFRNGSVTNLGRWNGTNAYALGITVDGHIIGCVDQLSGSYATLYYKNGVTNLGTLGGTYSAAYGVNDSLQIVGSSTTTNDDLHAFFWQNGSMGDLNQLLSSGSGWTLAEAYGINKFGNIVGWGVINGQQHAFFYQNGSVADLGVLSGGISSYAYGLNNSNDVVGTASIGSSTHAFLWQGGYLNDLNSLIAPGSGWSLREAWGINDSGQIIGWGVVGGEPHAFLLNPISNGGSGGFSLASGLGAFGPLTPGSFTVTITNPADGDTFDAVVNIAINADPSDSFGTVTQVQFFSGIKLLGTATTSPWTMTWSNVNTGTYPLTAVAQDDTGFSVTSSVVTITVGTNLPPVADSYVVDGYSTYSNFGTKSNLLVRTPLSGSGDVDRITWFKFAIDSLTNLNNVSSVKLKVFASANGGNTTVYSSANTSWGEYSITWNNQPSFGGAMDTVNIVDSGGAWYTFDVTGYVKSKISANSLITLVLAEPVQASPALVSMNSRENATNQPSLVVVTTNSAPSISITNPVNNATFSAPTNISIGATASDDGMVAQVQFYAGGKLLATLTNAPYSMTWSNAPVGTYDLTAVAVDNNGASTTSSSINITVNTNLPDIADAHVRDGSFTTANFGTNAVMEIQTGGSNTNRDDYLKFDISGITNWANISRVNLQVFAAGSLTNAVKVVASSVTNNSWDELAITWSNRPARIASLNTNTISGTNGNWYNFDVTSYFKSQQSAGQSVISLALHQLATNNVLISVNSKENTNQPMLVIATTNAPPTVNITNPANNAVYVYPTSAINLSANANDDSAVSHVEFFQGTTPLGILTSAPYNLAWSNPPGGTYSLTAVATDEYGLRSTSSVVTVIVDLPPVITLTNPIDYTIFPTNVNIAIGASASDSDGTITQVQIFQGTTSLAIDTNAPFTMTWSNVTAGIYTLTAIATDNYGATGTSAPVHVNVTDLVMTNNMRMWLKAETLGLTNNALVGTWTDSSGWSNNATQSNSSYQPLYITNAINGFPIVRFNGTSSFFNLPNVLNNTTGAEIFVVLKANANPTGWRAQWRFGGYGPGPGDHSPAYPSTDGLQIKDDFGSTNLYQLGHPVQPLDQYHLYEVAGENGFWAAWLNGQLLTNSANNTYGYTNAPTLGEDSVYSDRFEGDMAEVLLFGRVLTSDERASVGKYLYHKYQIASTPPSVLVTALTSTQLNLSWTTNGSLDLTTYRVDRKSGVNDTYAQIGAVSNGVSFLDSNVSPDTNYYYRVTASNYFGGSFSTEVSPPVVTITNLISGSFVVNTNITLAINAYDSDGSVTQVQAYVGSVSLGTLTSSPYAFSWPSPFPTAYTLSATALDNAGNSRISAPVSVTLALDLNNDGIPDISEVLDGNDPLNPWIPPSGDTNSTPPNINLIVPANATLLP